MKMENFESRMKCSLPNLREEDELTDFTFLFITGQTLKVHKVVLSAFSSFFRNFFNGTNMNMFIFVNQAMFMKGVLYEDMLAIINFIYKGVVEIPRKSLDSFLSLAKDFEIEGCKELKNISNCSSCSREDITFANEGSSAVVDMDDNENIYSTPLTTQNDEYANESDSLMHNNTSNMFKFDETPETVPLQTGSNMNNDDITFNDQTPDTLPPPTETSHNATFFSRNAEERLDLSVSAFPKANDMSIWGMDDTDCFDSIVEKMDDTMRVSETPESVERRSSCEDLFELSK